VIKKYFYKKDFYSQLPSLLIIIGLFGLVSYFTQENVEIIGEIILKGGNLSVLLYILTTFLAIVAAPLTSIPLIPAVVQVWGIFLTSLFSIIGWTIGSLGAFWIARAFGVSIVSKVESLERIRTVVNRIPRRKMFWYMIFLRLTIPVDILSYALGLFTKVSWKMFLLTTFIGVIPITFLFSYIGLLPMKIQLPLIATGIIIIIIFFLFHSRRTKKI